MSKHDAAFYDATLDEQLRGFVDEHRLILASCLEGLSEAQARQRLVPSKTTLLGLYVEAEQGPWYARALAAMTARAEGALTAARPGRRADDLALTGRR